MNACILSVAPLKMLRPGPKRRYGRPSTIRLTNQPYTLRRWHPNTAALAEAASLVGDLARAGMLAALMDGRALTAGELARVAGVTPQTASGHLARLTDAGLIVMERQGRHRYHRLASPTVARMVERLMLVAVDLGGRRDAGSRRPETGPRDTALRYARTCYDHLAGQLAVALADRMVERGQVELSGDGGELTADGAAFLRELGMNIDVVPSRASNRGTGRAFCRPCLDWSERRPNIAGAVGAALCKHCFDQHWLRRAAGTRAVTVTRRVASRWDGLSTSLGEADGAAFDFQGESTFEVRAASGRGCVETHLARAVGAKFKVTSP